ncbi:MAG TPA: alpha/beta fold hydrolase [Candidatus Avamphibacillus intestinigallinarum]|nr:alpha/beta fold hydrolase [Candidatus Avamphibacillus intestinigallinarum]
MVGCLVIHGFTGRIGEVQPLIDYLSTHTDWQWSVPILPGHGETLDLKGKPYESWLEAAVHAYEELHKTCTTIYVIGFSMGGMIAAYIAARFQVEKLVLLAPALRIFSVRQLTKEFGGILVDAHHHELASNLMYRNSLRKFSDTPLTSVIEFLKLVKYVRPFLKQVNTPVWVGQGRQDAIVPYGTMKEINQLISSTDKQFVLFNDSGHFLCLDESKNEVSRLVLQFLTGS